MKKKARKIFTVLISAALLLAAAALVPDFIVVNKAKNSIVTLDEAAELSVVDCAVILGAGVRNGKPTAMLRDRLLVGIELYKSGAAKKLIMSGDHGNTDYDEVNTMKSFAVENVKFVYSVRKDLFFNIFEAGSGNHCFELTVQLVG